MILNIFFLSLIGAPLQVEVTQHGKPVPQQEVSIFVFGNAQQEELKSKTNSSGIATFSKSWGKDKVAIAGTVFQGLSYFSDPQSLQKPEKISLLVYPTKPSDPQLVIERLEYFISSPKRGEADVVVTASLNNRSQFSIVGEGEHPETFRMNLPADAFGLKFLEGVEQETTHFEGNEFAISRPILPGRFKIAYRFKIRNASLSVYLEQKASSLIEEVLVTSPLSLNISGLDLKMDAKKLYQEEWVQIQRGFLHKKDLKIIAQGLPFYIAWTAFGGWLVGLIFLLLGGWASRKSRTKDIVHSDPQQHSAYLSELVRLETLLNQKAITKAQFENERFRILQKLIPFYLDERFNSNEHA